MIKKSHGPDPTVPGLGNLWRQLFCVMGHNSAAGTPSGFLQLNAALVRLGNMDGKRCKGIKKLVSFKEKYRN